jgi:hypothetical protein
MKKKQGIRIAVAAAFLAASVASGFALAVNEAEPNYPIAGTPPNGSAQKLTMGSDGSVTVYGVMGSATGATFPDVDFYTFEAWKGNVLTIDIDDGIKPSGSGLRSVDTTLAILGLVSQNYPKLRENLDMVKGTQDCTVTNCHWDAYIKDFVVPEDGWYTVGVTGHPRVVLSGGFFRDGSSAPSNGSYTLIISGVVPAEQNIVIDIKPGNKQETKINPKAKGVVPVALLSSETFDALKVDQSSLTFGATGDENTLAHCQKEGKDVNGDGRPDLVCHFNVDSERSGFDESVVEGVAKGKGADGKRFKGHGHLKVFGAEKRKDD